METEPHGVGPHDVVKLLLARMKSHPEEFKGKEGPYNDRWYEYITGIHTYGNETDKAAINAGIRDIRLGQIHEHVMDELCNGDERRRKEVEDYEYERHLAAAMQHTKQQQQLRVGTASSDINPTRKVLEI